MWSREERPRFSKRLENGFDKCFEPEDYDALELPSKKKESEPQCTSRGSASSYQGAPPPYMSLFIIAGLRSALSSTIRANWPITVCWWSVWTLLDTEQNRILASLWKMALTRLPMLKRSPWSWSRGTRCYIHDMSGGRNLTTDNLYTSITLATINLC